MWPRACEDTKYDPRVRVIAQQIINSLLLLLLALAFDIYLINLGPLVRDIFTTVEKVVPFQMVGSRRMYSATVMSQGFPLFTASSTHDDLKMVNLDIWHSLLWKNLYTQSIYKFILLLGLQDLCLTTCAWLLYWDLNFLQRLLYVLSFNDNVYIHIKESMNEFFIFKSQGSIIDQWLLFMRAP